MKKSKKKLIILILVLLVVIVGIVAVIMSCSSAGEEDGDSAQDSKMLVEPLQKHDLTKSISVSGTIESQTTVSVTSDLTYKIAQLNVQVGDYVNAGDVLCVFDDTDLKAQIRVLEEQQNNAQTLESKQNEINNRSLKEAKEEQERQLAEAKKAIEKAQNAYNNAVAAKANIENAYNSCQNQIRSIENSMNAIANSEGQNDTYYNLEGQLADLTVSSNELLAQLNEAEQTIASCQSDLDSANTNYSTTERTTNQQVQNAQDEIDTQGVSAEANTTAKELEELRRKLDKITVVAEHSGLITSMNITSGSIHAGGELMTIQDTNALKLTVSIKETDILNVQEGMRAIVTTNASEDMELEGKVSKVVNFVSTPGANSGTVEGANTNSGGYSAEITLEGDPNLLLGMNAKAKIMLSDEEQTLAVGYDSILEDEDGSYVYRAVPTDKSGYYRIERADVTPGTDSDYYTAITSDELSEGDYIILYPTEVNEGDVVEVDETYLEDVVSREDSSASDSGDVTEVE